jgi:hypothetical protein
MTRKERALVLLVGGLAVSAIAQGLVKHEAAVLGLTASGVALIGLALPFVLKRIA